MSAAEPPDLFGCSAGLCADRGAQTYEEKLAVGRHGKQGPRTLPQETPQPCDAFTGCLRCGLKVSHQHAGACIAALRDRLADVTGR